MGVNEVTIVVEKESAIGPNIPIFVLNVGGKQNAEALAVVASNWSSQVSAAAAVNNWVGYCSNCTRFTFCHHHTSPSHIITIT